MNISPLRLGNIGVEVFTLTALLFFDTLDHIIECIEIHLDDFKKLCIPRRGELAPFHVQFLRA